MHALPQAPKLALPRATLDRDALTAAIAWAEAAYFHCDVCAERCGVDRHAGPAGRCGLPADAAIYKEYLHLGEERLFVPGHAIYLGGCNLRCTFCSDDDAVRRPLMTGVRVSPQALAARIAERRKQGATNVNFVGGVPDVNVLYVLKTLRHVPDDTHVVWNTNLWTTTEAVDILRPLIGTWLVDHKFGNDHCGLRFGGVRGYDTLYRPLFDHLVRQGAPTATGGPRPFVFIRHLLMPGHLACCTRPILGWLAAHHPAIPVNVMTGYHPYRMARANNAMARRMPPAEVAEAIAWYRTLPFVHPHLDGVPLAPGE